MRYRIPPLLPTTHPGVGGESQFEEDELAVRAKNTPHSANCRQNIRDRPQRESADYRIHASFFERDSLPRQFQILDIESRSVPRPFCKSNHPRIGLEGVKLRNARRIIVGE